MKVDFEDGSFIAIEPSGNDSGKLNIIMCGVKDASGATVMASSELDSQQVVDLVKFLMNWVENLEVE